MTTRRVIMGLMGPGYLKFIFKSLNISAEQKQPTEKVKKRALLEPIVFNQQLNRTSGINSAERIRWPPAHQKFIYYTPIYYSPK